MNVRDESVIRDVFVLIGGVALCVILMAVGTYAVLRTTSVGQLLSDVQNTRYDPAARSEVLAGYDDSFQLVTETLPRLLTIVGLAISVIVGAFVGTLAAPRRAWMSVVSVLPLAATVLVIQPTARASWLFAFVWMGAALAAANVARRWRSR